ncbi:MAG: GNAT family N-acetyltransferase [Bacteroidales bacterium]|nr:GNAT family N-acetyltransferase [Bacteroidales bacterium]
MTLCENKYKIREMRHDEYPMLNDFLYQAIFQPDKTNLAPRSVIERPELQVYIKDFGTKKDDHCLCAEADGKVVGAVWVRNIDGYGNIGNATVEFAISVFDDYQQRGIGTALMRHMIALLKSLHYHQASLAVQKANYAVRMYKKVGLEIIGDTEQEFMMIINLSNK